jgi:hypothetical protein
METIFGENMEDDSSYNNEELESELGDCETPSCKYYTKFGCSNPKECEFYGK